MKQHVIVYLILCFTLCSCKDEVRKESAAPADFLSTTVDFIVKQSADQYIEFPALYDSLVTSIPEDNQEQLQLVQLLKNKGFKITQYGRGNYPPRGARIVSVDMTNETCNCNVNKIYYFTVSDDHYEVAERIKCIKLPSN